MFLRAGVITVLTNRASICHGLLHSNANSGSSQRCARLPRIDSLSARVTWIRGGLVRSAARSRGGEEARLVAATDSLRTRWNGAEPRRPRITQRRAGPDA